MVHEPARGMGWTRKHSWSIVKFQVQIQGHNKQDYEEKWQGWQNWTDAKLATNLAGLTKD